MGKGLKSRALQLLHILMAVFLVYQSIDLLEGLVMQKEIDHWGVALATSVAVNAFVTGAFAFSGFALPTQNLLPACYYQIKHPAKIKSFYNSIRADVYRKYLIKFIWGKPKKKKEYFSGCKSGIKAFIINTHKSEFGHLLSFILITILVTWFLFYKKYWLGFFTQIINIIFNFYPVIIQRHHRARLSTFINRKQI